MDFGSKVRQLRIEHGKSQVEMAAEIREAFGINMSQAKVSALEDRITLPAQRTLDAIAAYFGVPSAYFLSNGASLDANIPYFVTMDELKVIQLWRNKRMSKLLRLIASEIEKECMAEEPNDATDARS